MLLHIQNSHTTCCAQAPKPTDLLAALDIYNPRFQGIVGNWERTADSITLNDSGWIDLPFSPQGVIPNKPIEAATYKVILVVTRLDEGFIAFGLPVISGNAQTAIPFILDQQPGCTGPAWVDGVPLPDHRSGLKHSEPLIPLNTTCTIELVVTPKSSTLTELKLSIDGRLRHAFPIDATQMKGKVQLSERVLFSPWDQLKLGGVGRFRFTSITASGPGIYYSVRDPSQPLAIKPQAPSGRNSSQPMVPSVLQVPAITELATGTWEIVPLNEHVRFQFAKLIILSSENGDVKGAIEWIGKRQERAYEIVRGRIHGDQLTLHGIDQQIYLLNLQLGRYSGTVSKGGRTLDNVTTVQDGRRVRDEDENERWKATWKNANKELLPLTQKAFEAAFRPVAEEDKILRHFTDYDYWTKLGRYDFRHSHRPDRYELLELVSSANPTIRNIALAMMQGEILRDMKNEISNISASANQIRTVTEGFTKSLLDIMVKRDEDLSDADDVIDERQRIAATEEANRQYANSITDRFCSVFNSRGAKEIARNTVDRLQISLLGWDTSQLINHQVIALLRAKPAPAQALNDAFNYRIDISRSVMNVVVSNKSKAPLSNCVFVTEFNVDRDSLESTMGQEVINNPFFRGLLDTVGALDDSTTELADAEQELRNKIALHDTGAMIHLPEMQPNELVTIKLSHLIASEHGQSARLHYWSEETGYQVISIPVKRVAAEARRALRRR